MLFVRVELISLKILPGMLLLRLAKLLGFPSHYVDVTLLYRVFLYVLLRHLATKRRFNLLKPTGHVMHQQFNIQQLYVLSIPYLCVTYLSENKQRLSHLQHKLIGFYNRDEKCLLRGTNWFFK